MKSQKGITLIALVITIIVMLILVGVSITMAVNGGLFQYAGDAAKGTNEAKTQESELGKGVVTVTGENAPSGNQNINDIVSHYTSGN